LGHGALAVAAGWLARAITQSGGAGAWTVLDVSYIGLGSAVVKVGGSVLLAYFETSLAHRTASSLRDDVAKRLVLHGHASSRPRLLALIQNRLRELEGAMAHGVIAGVRAVAQLAPIALGLIFVSPSLALVGATVLIPFGIALAVLRRRWKAKNQAVQAVAEEIQTGVDELVENLDVWRVHGAGDRARARIQLDSHRAAQLSSRVEAERALLSGGNEALAALALVLLCWLAARAQLPLGDGTLIAFAAMVFMAYRPLRDLGDSRAWCSRGNLALAAIADALAVPHQPEAPDRQPRVSLEPAELIASGLGARERGPRTSFRLGLRETLAIVGENGSGKTTLLRVLLGLEPAVGTLTWAGVSLDGVGVGLGARPFAWAAQEAPLVTGTVLENVALSCGSEPVARRALESLGAGELAALADLVGPGGRPLSGGERRLVSLARAVASQAPVLLLDEPTLGLSDGGRARVIAALERLRRERAVLVVTHDTGLIELCDRAISLGNSEAALAAE
jgi:ABC-type multidrug transport system fused ATPase/permease subunit